MFNYVLQSTYRTEFNSSDTERSLCESTGSPLMAKEDANAVRWVNTLSGLRYARE
jgi:hypothetical protein